MLTRFNNGASNLKWVIVIDDETCICCYDPKTEQQSTVWVFQNKPKPTKVAREKSSPRKKFFEADDEVEINTGHCCFREFKNRE